MKALVLIAVLLIGTSFQTDLAKGQNSQAAVVAAEIAAIANHLSLQPSPAGPAAHLGGAGSAGGPDRRPGARLGIGGGRGIPLPWNAKFANRRSASIKPAWKSRSPNAKRAVINPDAKSN